MPGIARSIIDRNTCILDAHKPAAVTGKIINGSPNVKVNLFGAVRVTDSFFHSACSGSNRFTCIMGSSSVFVNLKPVVRMGDQTQHCGGIGSWIIGSTNVIAGG